VLQKKRGRRWGQQLPSPSSSYCGAALQHSVATNRGVFFLLLRCVAALQRSEEGDGSHVAVAFFFFLAAALQTKATTAAITFIFWFCCVATQQKKVPSSCSFAT
jgi:hypothetical protein